MIETYGFIEYGKSFPIKIYDKQDGFSGEESETIFNSHK